MQWILFWVVVVMLYVTADAEAKTLMLEGGLNSSIAMRQQMEFNVDKGGVDSFTFRFALPADFHSKSVYQSVDSLLTDITPKPASSTVEKDRFGNHFQKVSWKNLAGDIRIKLNYTVNIRSELSAMESRTPFPIGTVSDNDALYLKTTEMVQADSSDIVALARQLTAGVKNEYEAVSAITNHVSDSIKYAYNPVKYDALYTLETKSGNCQNFAHLSIALLRSVGIPARIVGGITLKNPWKVPIDKKNTIVQSMGQGGHAWIEIYFPDLGWLQYDPQQSRQFTSSRHIKQSHGLDSRDINDTWSGAPYLPRYSELLEGSLLTDDIKLAVKSSGKNPRSYIISNLVAAKTALSSEEIALEILRVETKKRESERVARENLEREAQERAEQERVNTERLAALKAEQERKALVLAEKDRLVREQIEAVRLARIKVREELKARQDAEKNRIALKKAEAARIGQQKAAEKLKARQDAEKKRIALKNEEADRIAQLKAKKELKASQDAENKRLALEKVEAERVAQLKEAEDLKVQQDSESKRLALERAEAKRIAQLKEAEELKIRQDAENKRLALEIAEAERVAQLKEADELKAQHDAEIKRLASEKAEADRIAQLKAAEELKARQDAENERLAWEKAEAEHIAQIKVASELKARRDAENKRLALEIAEAERVEQMKIMSELKARQDAEKKRLTWKRAEAERIAQLQAAEELKAKQDAENKRIALEKTEAERISVPKVKLPPAQKPSKPAVDSEILFGNMDFPNLVNGYSIQGNVGTRILDKETSEYVTSQYIFAQAFDLKNEMSLDKVSLAMRKFGGDGNMYVDLVRDNDGRPNILDGIRSRMVSLESISRKPGYYWIDFSFSTDSANRLKPGKYWIVLRSSGEAIVNWFYIPGKPYGDSDDTRSTVKGFLWEDILTYDFVFKVAGKVI